ncbi:MAG: hypothetical protein U0K68_10320 [Agathobacter sp.]|nr:hypothetical protein [Agathobacter sp.]
MKKKLLFTTLFILFLACFTACGSNSLPQGANIFNDKLDSVQKINIILPDVKTIDNKEDVKQICDIILNQTYSEMNNPPLIEGCFILELVGDENIEIGLISNRLSINDKVYEARDKEAFTTIYNLFRE